MKCNWFSPLQDVTIKGGNNFTNGIVNLHVERNHNFISDDRPFFYNDKTGILCSVIGYISNLEFVKSKYSINSKSDTEIIERLYSLKKLQFISDLDGIFLVCILDENSQKFYVLQSELGFSLPVYYTCTENEFIFSTSLKQIIKHMTNKRALDINAVYDFLYFRTIIPNEKTLIKKVYKLVPQQYISVDCVQKTFQIKPLIKRDRSISKHITNHNLIESLDTSIGNLFNQLRTKNITQALTAGWDSNVILFFLNKLSHNATVRAVTISGGGEKNEVPSTRSIVDQYEGVEHITGEVGVDVIDFLPDIVWRYEGYLFDEGMFLRYELARVLEREKSKFVFLGSCADQVLSPKSKKGILYPKGEILKYLIEYMFKNTIRRTPIGDIYHRVTGYRSKKEEIIRKKLGRRLLRRIYDVGIDHNLKLHELMLNSFGTQGIYPFVNKETAELSAALGPLMHQKQFYKEQVKELICCDITQHFKKSGSVVDTKHLFNVKKDLLIKVLESGLIRSILSKYQIDEILQEPEQYHILIFQLAYIYIFNEIFITGKYDSRFDASGLSIPLTQIFATI